MSGWSHDVLNGSLDLVLRLCTRADTVWRTLRPFKEGGNFPSAPLSACTRPRSLSTPASWRRQLRAPPRLGMVTGISTPTWVNNTITTTTSTMVYTQITVQLYYSCAQTPPHHSSPVYITPHLHAHTPCSGRPFCGAASLFRSGAQGRLSSLSAVRESAALMATLEAPARCYCFSNRIPPFQSPRYGEVEAMHARF